MIKFNLKLKKFLKRHRWQSAICIGVLFAGVGACSIGFVCADNANRIANSKALLEMAEENGIISTEDIENAGDLADLGTEIETDEGTVVLTKDENGNIVKTVVKDKDGNPTGAIIPVDNNSSNSYGQQHSHTYVAHYVTRTRNVTNPVYHPAEYATEKYSVQVCNVCGAEDVHRDTHKCNGGMYNSGTRVKTRQVLVRDAWTEYVNTQENYQEIDYYYCSDCGARQ